MVVVVVVGAMVVVVVLGVAASGLNSDVRKSRGT